MIEHVYRRAQEARYLDAVVVATDDDRVADAVDAFGGTAVTTSADHATGTDRLAEVARALSCEIVVNVQRDEPLIEPSSIDAVVKLVLDRPEDVMSTVRRRIDDATDLTNPSVVKVVTDARGYALYVPRSAVPYVRPDQPAPIFWRHLGLYGYRRSFLLQIAALPSSQLERAEGLEQVRALEHGDRISTADTTADSIGVDTLTDLERVRQLLEPAART